jgi:molybdopterin molybdotransferase
VREGTGIPDTNRVTLLCALEQEGAEAVDLGIVPDDSEALSHALGTLPPLDALLTTGGASMGERDLLKRTLGEFGFELGFWRTLIRPGSPFSFGHLARDSVPPLPVFGLPGNPSSAFVTFHTLVAPFLRRISGSTEPAPPRVPAETADRLQSPEHLTHFFRVELFRDSTGGALRCRLTGHQGSGLISPLAPAVALAVVPRGVTTVHPGDSVDVLLLPGATVRENAPPLAR